MVILFLTEFDLDVSDWAYKIASLLNLMGHAAQLFIFTSSGIQLNINFKKRLVAQNKANLLLKIFLQTFNITTVYK